MKKKQVVLTIYTPTHVINIKKYCNKIEKQRREIEDAEIVEEYSNKIKDREMPLFIQEY